MLRASLVVVGLTALLTLPGCIIVAGGGRTHHTTRVVETDGMTDLMAANTQARLGETRVDTLALYPAELLTLMSVFADDGTPVEAWQVFAISRDGRASFTRWLYFYDGKLAQLSDERLDLDARPELLASWRDGN